MKRLLYIICICFCSSCSIANYSLTGSYPSFSYTASTTQSADKIWSKVVDWFFTTETPIALIDKSSGIVISKSISLSNKATSEVNGHASDKNAYCVVPDVRYASRILGTVMIRVKTVGDKTKIQVALGDLICECGDKYKYFAEVKSLGVFEQQLLKYICQ